MKEKGISASVDAAQIVEAANAFLGDRFNDPRHRAVRAVSYRGGFLTVACRSPAHAQEVKMAEPELALAIRGRQPGARVDGLRFIYSGDMLRDAD